MVKSKVMEYENISFTTCLMYSSIPYFVRNTMEISIWFWWNYVSVRLNKFKKCKVIDRMLYGILCLTSDTTRYNHSQMYDNWSHPHEETAAHILFACCHLAEVREWKWDKFVGAMPDEMFTHVRTLNAVGKTFCSKQVITV